MRKRQGPFSLGESRLDRGAQNTGRGRGWHRFSPQGPHSGVTHSQAPADNLGPNPISSLRKALARGGRRPAASQRGDPTPGVSSLPCGECPRFGVALAVFPPLQRPAEADGSKMLRGRSSIRFSRSQIRVRTPALGGNFRDQAWPHYSFYRQGNGPRESKLLGQDLPAVWWQCLSGNSCFLDPSSEWDPHTTWKERDTERWDPGDTSEPGQCCPAFLGMVGKGRKESAKEGC